MAQRQSHVARWQLAAKLRRRGCDKETPTCSIAFPVDTDLSNGSLYGKGAWCCDYPFPGEGCKKDGRTSQHESKLRMKANDERFMW